MKAELLENADVTTVVSTCSKVSVISKFILISVADKNYMKMIVCIENIKLVFGVKKHHFIKHFIYISVDGPTSACDY